MKQESFAYQVSFPKCGNSGQATMFENHNAACPDAIVRRVETLPKGMAAGPIDQVGDQQIICEVCNTLVPIARP